MRTPEEIADVIEGMTKYEALTIEIMCNIAITLDKIQKEISDEE